VQRASHDTIGGVECLLDTVAVMDVDVNVEHPGMISVRDASLSRRLETGQGHCAPQEFEDAQDDVVDVAESAGFALLGVM
jgi:hypothetical protein